jgi:hypothetical protein
VRRRTLARDRESARKLAAEAYVYLYPLVLMDATRRRMTNVSGAGDLAGRAPKNEFAHLRRYPPAGCPDFTLPDFDTLHSYAWIDVAEEPVIVSVPDAGDRYYLLPIYDMWSDLVASPGTRTGGNWPARYGVVSRGFEGDLPEGVRRMEAHTSCAWISGRIQCDAEDQFAYATGFQDLLQIEPLSRFGLPRARPRIPTPVESGVDDPRPPREQVDAMEPSEFFARASELVRRHPPHTYDHDLLLRIERIGFVPGERFDVARLPRAVAESLRGAVGEARLELRRRSRLLGRPRNGWIVNSETTGAWRSDYLRRAATALISLGMPAPEDLLQPTAAVDDRDRPLHGAHRYVLRFERHQLPPVHGFWSLTLYGDDGRAPENGPGRHTLRERDGLERGADGSLEIAIQRNAPAASPVSNWLPAPDALFRLCLRLYWPTAEALERTWAPPPVLRLNHTSPGRAVVSTSGRRR